MRYPPRHGSENSKNMRNIFHQLIRRKKSSNTSSFPAASAAPITLPDEEPATQEIFTPYFISVRITPKCAMPRTPPEPSASPILNFAAIRQPLSVCPLSYPLKPTTL